MIKYEDLARVNQSLTKIKIKGKDYAIVAEKVRAFRELFPNGSIQTEILSDDGERCVVKATAYDEDGKVLGTGHAFEMRAGSNVNKFAYLENCETSATGRALSMCGIGSGEFASADEMSGVIAMAEWSEKTIEPRNVSYLEHLIEVTNSDRDKFLKYFGVEEMTQIKNPDYRRAVDMLEDKMEV